MTHDPVFERIRQLVTAIATEMDDGEGLAVSEIVDEVMSRSAESIRDAVRGMTMSVVADSFDLDDDAEPDGDGEVVDGELADE